MFETLPFANRLNKNARHWGKWARRQGIGCYRLYDRDIPQFPFAIDWYEGRAYLQEYDTGWEQTEDEYRRWCMDVCDAVATTLDIPLDRVYLKTRQRQKGTQQYEKTGQAGERFVVTENGRRFRVNLGAYLDTGLFLDHRNTRKKVGDLAAGKRVLNLFSYTGSFTVYAATGGALSSETVDLSNTYLDWAGDNFALNGLDETQHVRVRADVLQYLKEAVAHKKQFDLIVLDPPSFSNSKKMQGVLDVQRDHVWMIDQCLAILAQGGLLIFSNNLRSFELDTALNGRALIKDVTKQSVPEDFQTRTIHHCFEICHRG